MGYNTKAPILIESQKGFQLNSRWQTKKMHAYNICLKTSWKIQKNLSQWTSKVGTKKCVKQTWLKFTSNKEIERNIFNTWSYWIRGWFYEVNESLNLQLEVVWKDLSKAYVKSIKSKKLI
jgi:hypothetical protein